MDINDLLRYYSIDLQLFANPEDEGRTEDPSERKKREKREEGEVAKSQDLTVAIVFIVTFIVLWGSFQTIIESISVTMKQFLGNLEHNFTQQGNSDVLFLQMSFWKAIFPTTLAAMVAAVIASVVQVGFLIAPKALEPKFNKLSFTFTKFMERIVFSKAIMMNLILSVSKVFILGLVFIILIKMHLSQLLNLTGMGIEPAISAVLRLVIKMFIACGIFLIVLGVPDYFSKRKQFQDSLKITKSESKREYRQEEGDPQVKGFLKEMYARLLQKQAIKTRVPEADIVITNPTHFAVALKYDMNTMESPMVIAKGEDETALLIKETAKEHGVEILENPPLARELYKLLNVGDYIPAHLTMVIAEIFVKLYQDGKWEWDQNQNDRA